jgi:hypothetical protein
MISLMTLVFAMQGCVATDEVKNIEIADKPLVKMDNKKPITVHIKLGEASTYNFYNVNQPMNIVFKAPEDAVILYKDGKSAENVTLKMNKDKLSADFQVIFKVHAVRAAKEEGKIARMLITNYKINVQTMAKKMDT